MVDLLSNDERESLINKICLISYDISNSNSDKNDKFQGKYKLDLSNNMVITVNNGLFLLESDCNLLSNKEYYKKLSTSEIIPQIKITSFNIGNYDKESHLCDKVLCSFTGTKEELQEVKIDYITSNWFKENDFFIYTDQRSIVKGDFFEQDKTCYDCLLLNAYRLLHKNHKNITEDVDIFYKLDKLLPNK